MKLTDKNYKEIFNKIKDDGTYIRFIENPTQDLIDLSLISSHDTLKYLPHTDYNILKSLTINACNIKLKIEINYNFILQALKINPICYGYIDSIIQNNNWQTKEVVNLMIKEPSNIFYIKNQTEELCWLAIKSDKGCLSLRGIKNPTEEMLWYYIHNNDIFLSELENIRNFTNEMLIALVNKNLTCIKWIKMQTEELCDIAVNLSPVTIQFIKKPTLSQMLLSINNNIQFFDRIKIKDQKIEVIIHMLNLIRSGNYISVIYSLAPIINNDYIPVPHLVKDYPYLLNLNKNQTKIDVEYIYNIVINNFQILNKKHYNPIIKGLFLKNDKISFELALNLLKFQNEKILNKCDTGNKLNPIVKDLIESQDSIKIHLANSLQQEFKI